jgi:hypothetical protein
VQKMRRLESVAKDYNDDKHETVARHAGSIHYIFSTLLKVIVGTKQRDVSLMKNVEEI